MRKVIFPVAFISVTTLAACSFQMKAGSGANNPQGNNNQPANTPATNTPVATSTVPQPAKPKALGKVKIPNPSPTTTATTLPTTSPTTPPAPTGIPLLSGSIPFGNGTADATAFKGNIYWIPAGTTKLPALASTTPNGVLFAKELNVASRAFTEGFPGVDAARKENFAIRYEAALVVENEADYDFRLVSDDGSILSIDGMEIVNNDGSRTAAAEKSGPVHLVRGTHVMTVDYFQGTGNVALQLFCKKAGDAEKICPTRL